MKKSSRVLAIAVMLAIGFCHAGGGAEPTETAAGDLAPAGKRPWILSSSARPALLGRSHGGLWASPWAIAHPELTAGAR